MDASLLDIAIIAWVSIALYVTCRKLMQVICPVTADQIKVALTIRAMTAGMPAWLHPIVQLGMCLGALLLTTITWPYNLTRELWNASDTALTDQDLLHMLDAHQAYQTSLDNAFTVAETPKNPATDETQKMPVLPPDPFKGPPKGPGA